MPMLRPAAAIEPVSLIASKMSALPGPIAMSGSSTIRSRAPSVRLPAFMLSSDHVHAKEATRRSRDRLHPFDVGEIYALRRYPAG